MNRSHKFIFLILVIISLAFGVRIIYINGDAPVADISRSGVFYVDEGTYAHNIVNKILYDTWFIPEDYNAMSNVPVFTLMQYLIVKIVGLSLANLRYCGIIYVIIALCLFFYLIKQENLIKSLLFVLLAGFNYFFIIYNRLALLENLLILFLVMVTLCLYFYREKYKIRWLIAATVIFWTGFFVKATILFLLPLFIGVILVNPLSKQVKIKRLWIYSCVTSIILITVYIFWIKPHLIDWHYFEGRNIHKMINESFFIFLTNYARYFSNLKIFQFMPVTYIIFLLSIPYFIYELYKKRKLPFLNSYFLIWALCAFLFLGFFKYSPPRHSLILMPPIFFLTVTFLMDFYQGKINLTDKNIILLFLPVSILALGQIGFGIYRIVVYNQNYLSCYLPMISLFLIPFLYFSLKFNFNNRLTAISLFVFIFILNSYQIYNYYSKIQFSYYTAIQDMNKIIKEQEVDKKVLLGDIAPLVSVELKIKAVNIIFKNDTEDLRILNYSPNLLILQDNNELDRLKEKVPNYFDNIELIKSYEIFNNYRNNDDTYFYRIDNQFEDRLFVKK